MELICMPYGALCGLDLFIINGIDADCYDFGKLKDCAPDIAPEYGCGDMRFISDEKPQDGVLEKYHISYSEWEQVCQRLEVELHFGYCGLCT